MHTSGWHFVRSTCNQMDIKRGTPLTWQWISCQRPSVTNDAKFSRHDGDIDQCRLCGSFSERWPKSQWCHFPLTCGDWSPVLLCAICHKKSLYRANIVIKALFVESLFTHQLLSVSLRSGSAVLLWIQSHSYKVTKVHDLSDEAAAAELRFLFYRTNVQTTGNEETLWLCFCSQRVTQTETVSFKLMNTSTTPSRLLLSSSNRHVAAQHPDPAHPETPICPGRGTLSSSALDHIYLTI